MKINNCKVIVVSYTDNDFKKASEFADLRVEGSSGFYKSRGGGKVDKLKSDIRHGLLGEICVSKYFRSVGLSCTRPDTSIYSSKNKSYDPDLIVNNKARIHCKTQSKDSQQKYGVSYLCQKSDPVFKNPSCYDFMVTSVVDETLNLCFIYGIWSIKKIVSNNLIGVPVVPFLRTNKIAFYFDELDTLNKDAKWGLFRKQVGCPKFKYSSLNDYGYYRTHSYLLINGKKVLLDISDLKKCLLSNSKWNINEKGYVKNHKCKYIHQTVLPPKKGYVTDHINRDPLDNRKNNLRYATRTENLRNSKPSNRGGKFGSKYKGVNKRRGGSDRWVVYITVDSVSTYVGDFSTEKEAALAYNKMAKKYYGEFAYLNTIK